VGNWTIIIHGVGQHGVFPPKAEYAKNVEQSALEIVEKLRADGQTVSDCLVVAGAASRMSLPTVTGLGILEAYDARTLEPAPVEPVNAADVPGGRGGHGEDSAPQKEVE